MDKLWLGKFFSLAYSKCYILYQNMQNFEISLFLYGIGKIKISKHGKI